MDAALDLLQKEGYIELQTDRRRGKRILLQEIAWQSLGFNWNLLGSIPAGPLSDSPEETSRRIESIADLIPSIRPGDYFLTVDGDSMIDAGLQPGQYVVIRPEKTPVEGSICAVWIDGEGGTLKRVYTDSDGMVRLVPANPKYRPHTYPAEKIRIQGVLVAAVAVQEFRK
jgi:repressor LexA